MVVSLNPWAGENYVFLLYLVLMGHLLEGQGKIFKQ